MYSSGPTGAALSALVTGSSMYLYTAAVQPRTGRPTVTVPRRTGRPALTLPRRGPISATCRCGQERAAHELQLPGRDCARCAVAVAR